jgi:hypothetical protein
MRTPDDGRIGSKHVVNKDLRDCNNLMLYCDAYTSIY